MTLGRIYRFHGDIDAPSGGHLAVAVDELQRLETRGSRSRLTGRFVVVHNGGEIGEPDPATGVLHPTVIGDARPDAAGDFIFDPGRGGGRVDKFVGTPEFRERYRQASHFGEVNVYHHLDRIAAYVHELLAELGASPLPRVVAVANAHHGATERAPGLRDGRMLRGRWRPFQGGHYRLPARRYDVAEHHVLSPDGEIHFGPGRKILRHGALVTVGGTSYRANSAHNPGIIYHEYGHHLVRHTADLRGNALRRPGRGDNRKTALDEGTCDYWAAVMMGTPHIWACHRQHDEHVMHPRSLASRKTMAEFDGGRGADPHLNGTIWGAALWDLRTRLSGTSATGARDADRLVLQALLLVGRIGLDSAAPTARTVRRARRGFVVGLEALLAADRLLYAGRHTNVVTECLGARGILAGQPETAAVPSARTEAT